MLLLIICLLDLEVSLRMLANGAKLRSISANNNVTAVTAFPNLNLALLEDLVVFNVL